MSHPFVLILLAFLFIISKPTIDQQTSQSLDEYKQSKLQTHSIDVVLFEAVLHNRTNSNRVLHTSDCIILKQKKQVAVPTVRPFRTVHYCLYFVFTVLEDKPP